MKVLIDMSMDGYESKEEQLEAIKEFISDNLDFSASSVKILWDETESVDKLKDVIKNHIL